MHIVKRHRQRSHIIVLIGIGYSTDQDQFLLCSGHCHIEDSQFLTHAVAESPLLYSHFFHCRHSGPCGEVCVVCPYSELIIDQHF